MKTIIKIGIVIMAMVFIFSSCNKDEETPEQTKLEWNKEDFKLDIEIENIGDAVISSNSNSIESTTSEI